MRSILFSIFVCLPALGQTFDVASVKVNQGPMDNIETGVARHGTVTLHNTTLRECIAYAYGLTSAEEVVGPEWTGDRAVRFEIVAKAPPETPETALRVMLQRLLTERFHLELHRESRPVRHYDLEVAKGGAKIPIAAEDGARPRTVFGRARLDYSHTTMPELAMLLSMQLKTVVVDRTNLTGFYAVKFEWKREEYPDDPRPDLTDALTAIGLKLTASKAPIEVFVVDRADRNPVGN